VKHAALAALALALAGFASAAAPPSERGRIVVRGCDGLYYERPGGPQRIIVSDLPLEDSAHTAMLQMTQAIKLTVKDRDFRAGRYSVGYVVCDDTGPAKRWSAKRCIANARAAARNPRVVGVIGTLDSGCARAELPVLGRAKLVLVSPLNTAPDLTLSHRASVVRLSAPDHVQAAAAARFLRRRGVKTVAALSDGTSRGGALRLDFTRMARRLQLAVVARGRADAAYVGGVLAGPTHATLLAARRRAPSGPLALSAGYGPVAQLATLAGGTAEGAYLFVAGLPLERLGRDGGRFATHFESAIGTRPHPYAVYAAQAAALLLDGLAASNGSRQDVARKVRAAKMTQGLIGSISFDRNGDPVHAPVTVFRIHGRVAQVVRVVDSGLP
jgi:branched-chain amino acid transport system substrate-binding protein